jgi:phenylpropionate dioxygenase-like ring-hydroxylating dioxygenase large terminal subunit
MSISSEVNDALSKTGPDTLMGRLFRRYWIPLLISTELPENDGAPMRVTVLSEKLLAFRNTDGTVGLIDEFCAHRGVSLWFGRNEEHGIRCPYHGWKYDVNGQCVEVPSEPDESGYCQKIKLKSYPCVEQGGVIWTYMGVESEKPPLPKFEWNLVPPENRYVSKRWQECNYLQAMEGGIDSSHVSFLHSGELHTDPLHKGTKGAKFQGDKKPYFEVQESEGGLLIGARRNAEPGFYYWRISQWLMPWYTMIPPYGENALNGHAFVPIDDENCWVWSMTHKPAAPLSQSEIHSMDNGEGMYAELIPGTYLPVANKRNDYLIDRELQKTGRYYSGIKGIGMQDASLQESMGPLQDRTKENLVSTDNAIIMARNRLFKAARNLEKGIQPPGLSQDSHLVRSASVQLPVGASFKEAAAENLKAEIGKSHVSKISV